MIILGSIGNVFVIDASFKYSNRSMPQNYIQYDASLSKYYLMVMHSD